MNKFTNTIKQTGLALRQAQTSAGKAYLFGRRASDGSGLQCSLVASQTSTVRRLDLQFAVEQCLKKTSPKFIRMNAFVPGLALMLLLLSTNLFAQDVLDTVVVETQQPESDFSVSGQIRNEVTGAPVAGAYVSVPGYSSVLTDDDGKYSLPVPSPDAVIRISGEGYQQKEVPANGREIIDVALFDESYSSFYDVAYLPYSLKTQSQVTASVASVDIRDSWKSPAATPEDYLQGRIAGLDMTRRSGTPGIGANMFLRGYSSLHATNQPLVVVDGMIYDMEDYGGSIIGNYFSNPLSNIDIRDIDNITVLKDAAATSIYGSKAANGVILIRTAHARELATRIDFNAYGGVNFAPANIPVMGAEDYRVLLYDILSSKGLSGTEIEQLPYMNDDSSMPGYYNYHGNTNWQDQVFDDSFNQNYYLKVTGGDNIAKYALSLGYLNHKGIVKNTGYDRYNTRFNADLNISPKFLVNTNLAFTYSEHELKDEGINPKTNPIYLSLIKAPFLNPNVISDAGIVSPNLSDADIFGVSNPVSVINNMRAENRSYRFFGSANFNYSLTKELTLSSLIGITADKIRENVFVPRNGIVADTLKNAIAESRMQNRLQRLFSIYNDTRLGYSKKINRLHEVNGSLGFRYLSSKSEEDRGTGYNSPTDELQSLGTGVNVLRQVGGQIGEWKWLSMYGNIDYQLMNKYFVSLNVSADGSSRFGDEADGFTMFSKKFGTFPSVSVAWLLSSEKFMSGLDFTDLLKLRFSYGASGNDNIGNYSSQMYYVSQNFLGIQGLVRGNIYNPALQWETNRTYNLGLDFALFNERAMVSVDIYKNRTSDMLLFSNAPTASGADVVLTNDGGMTNKGIEVTFSSRLINKEDLKLEFGTALNAFRNKVTRLPEGDIVTEIADAYILTSTNKAANLFYGYETRGVYSSDEEAESAGYSKRLANGSLLDFQGGDVKFVDQNGDKVIDDRDRVVIGNPNPDLTGMFYGSLQWKRITLEANFTFSYGNKVYNYMRRQLESMDGYYNQTENVINRWRTDGQQTDVPRAVWGDPAGNSEFSDRWIENGSYLRLKTVSISYDIPVTGNFFKYVNAYVTGNNLLTFTKYLGYDPEFSATQSILGQGIDPGVVPQYRSVMIGLRIGL